MPKTLTQTNKIKLAVFLSLSALLIFFDVYKAATAPFTWDESFTYIEYVNHSYLDIFTYKISTEANNHILNTILAKFFASIGGPNELFLRLPNVLAHVLYLFCIYKLIRKFRLVDFIASLILLTLNPYFLDFFQLARGYGLGIAFTMAAVYNYGRYIEFKQLKLLAYTFGFLILACLSNFTFTTVFLVFALIHNLFILFIDRENFNFSQLLRSNAVVGLFSIICAALIYGPIKKLMTTNKLTEGGTTGIWHDTVESLLHFFAYEQPYENYLTLLFKILIIVFSFLFVHFLLIKQEKQSVEYKKTLVIGAIIFLVLLVIEMQHLILGTNYLKTRFALFLYPLFMLMVCFSGFDETMGFKKLKRTVLLAFSAVLLSHTMASINTKWYYEWKYMSVLDAKDILKKVNSSTNEKASISFGSTWIYQPVLEYYRQSLNLSNIQKIDWGINLDNDYFIVNKDELDDLQAENIEIVEYYPINKNYLVKPKNKGTAFRAFDNLYVCADEHIGNVLIANRVKPGLWERYFLMNENNRFYFKAHNSTFITIDRSNPDSEIKAAAENLDASSGFELVRINSSQFALKAANGKYVSVNTITHKLYANAEKIGKPETFTWN